MKPHCALDQQTFFDGHLFCLRNNYFTYDDTLYSQMTGLAMGSPLPAINADFAVDELFIAIMNKFNNDVRNLMRKYVDDWLLIIKEHIANKLHQDLYSFEPLLKLKCLVDGGGGEYVLKT